MIKTKTIVYFVSGGHGPTSCKGAWHQTDTYDFQLQTYLCIGVVDDGGNTGLMRRIFDKLNEEYVPLGDLRNLWASTVVNEEMSDLIQERIQDQGVPDNMNIIFVNKLKELKRFVAEICKGGKDLEKFLSDSEIESFVRKYIEGFEKLSDEEKRDIENVDGNIVPGKYIKHNIGNLFLAALTYSFKKRTGENGYRALETIINEIGLFEENINIRLMDDHRLTLVLQNEKGEIIEVGEDRIDIARYRIGVRDYEVYEPDNGQGLVSKAQRKPEISNLLNEADVIVIPPGSQSNSFPWIKYYAENLKSKLVIRIVNLAEEISADSIIEEIAFLESMGIKVIYMFPKSFNEVKERIGLDKYEHLKTKYLAQGKKPQDLSVDEIILGLKLNHPEIFQNTSEADLRLRILPIVQVNAFTNNGETIQELLAYNEDDPFIPQKGFRHDPVQLEEIIHQVTELSDLPTTEVAREMRRTWISSGNNEIQSELSAAS